MSSVTTNRKETKMFKLTSASVHYGTSSYPLHGLPAQFNSIECVEDVNLNDLSRAVGLLTGFPRDFTIRHIDRTEFPGIVTKDGRDLVIPEHIYASANGYSIRWDIVA
jgi:hypothetical protein